jgi:hypothetical protein
VLDQVAPGDFKIVVKHTGMFVPSAPRKCQVYK